MKEMVIKIPDGVYKYLEKRIKFGMTTEIERIVWNGTELPKGHGRLIDADRLAYDCGFDNGYGCERICHCDNCTYHIVKESEINNAKTLVEADKGEV